MFEILVMGGPYHGKTISSPVEIKAHTYFFYTTDPTDSPGDALVVSPRRLFLTDVTIITDWNIDTRVIATAFDIRELDHSSFMRRLEVYLSRQAGVL